MKVQASASVPTSWSMRTPRLVSVAVALSTFSCKEECWLAVLLVILSSLVTAPVAYAVAFLWSMLASSPSSLSVAYKFHFQRSYSQTVYIIVLFRLIVAIFVLRLVCLLFSYPP